MNHDPDLNRQIAVILPIVLTVGAGLFADTTALYQKGIRFRRLHYIVAFLLLIAVLICLLMLIFEVEIPIVVAALIVSTFFIWLALKMFSKPALHTINGSSPPPICD